MLCSVVKYAGSGRARKKCRGKHETQSSVFPHFLSALPLPKCFTTEHSTVETSLLHDKEFNNFPAHSLTKTLFSKGVKVAPAVYEFDWLTRRQLSLAYWPLAKLFTFACVAFERRMMPSKFAFQLIV